MRPSMSVRVKFGAFVAAWEKPAAPANKTIDNVETAISLLFTFSTSFTTPFLSTNKLAVIFLLIRDKCFCKFLEKTNANVRFRPLKQAKQAKH